MRLLAGGGDIMAKFEISCPHHGKVETLELPDSYTKVVFRGEVRCGDPEDSRPIKIEIVRGDIIKVERA